MDVLNYTALFNPKGTFKLIGFISFMDLYSPPVLFYFINTSSVLSA